MKAAARAYGATVHAKGCVCPGEHCDPNGTLMKAARERYLSGRRVPLAAPRPPAATPHLGTRPIVHRPPATAETRRLRELLATGIGFESAMQIIEGEKRNV